MRRTRTVGLALSWTLLLTSPSWPGPPFPESSPCRGLVATIARRAAEIGLIPPDRRSPDLTPAEPPLPLDQMENARRAPFPTPPTDPLVIPAVDSFQQFRAAQDEFHRVMGGSNAGTTGPMAEAPPVPASTTIAPISRDLILLAKVRSTIVPPAQTDPRVAPARPAPWEIDEAAKADFDRGWANYKAGRHDEAIAAFGRAIAAFPACAPPRVWRGASLICKKEFDRAIQDLDLAILLEPGDWYAFYCRGYARDWKREYRRAVADYSEAIRLGAGCPEVFSFLARVRLKLHDFGGTAGDLEAVVRLQPRNVDAIRQLAWLRATCPEDRVRDGRAAVALATSACEIDGGNSHAALATLAAAQAEAGDFDAALRRMKEAMAKVQSWYAWGADVVQFVHYATQRSLRCVPEIVVADAESRNKISVGAWVSEDVGCYFSLDWGPPRHGVRIGWRHGFIPLVGWY